MKHQHICMHNQVDTSTVFTVKYKQINTSKSASQYKYKYKPLFLKVISILV